MTINSSTINKKDISKNIIWIIYGIFLIVLIAQSIASSKWIYLTAIFIPFLIYLCIKNPFIFPFGAYVFLIPFDSVLSITGNSKGATLTKFLGIMAILILFLKGIFEEKLKKPNKVVIWWVLMIIYALSSILWAIEPDKTYSRFSTAAGLLILYLIASSYKINENEFNIFKWLIMFGGLVSAIFAIYNYGTGAFYGMRSTVEFGERVTNPNRFAFSLIIPISICIGLMLNQKMRVFKVILIIALSLFILGVIFTGSRGGLLGVAVVAIIYILFLKKRVTLLTIFLCIGLLSMSFVPDFFVQRWEEAIETGGSGRTTIWATGLAAIEKYWTIGAGLDNFANVYSEFSRFTPFSLNLYKGSHNLYLGVLIELGIIGLFLLSWVMLKHYRIIKSFLMRYDGNTIMLKASFWGVLITSFFGDTMWTKSFWLLWMLILMNRNVAEGEKMRFHPASFENNR
ncbi:MAG: O-antigen ligase family protein [Nitrospirae bacterium]|nr:O-antigen ligase family protein [Nitrospirota bacterium]